MVAVDGITILHGAGLQRLGKGSRGGCHADPDNGGSKETTQHHLTTTNFLDEVCTDDGEEELEAAVTEANIGLANRVIDSGSIKDCGQEVGERSVTAP